MNDRAERLKAALRENLKRRKAQVRGRTAADRPEGASQAEKPDRDPEPTPER